MWITDVLHLTSQSPASTFYRFFVSPISVLTSHTYRHWTPGGTNTVFKDESSPRSLYCVLMQVQGSLHVHM